MRTRLGRLIAAVSIALSCVVTMGVARASDVAVTRATLSNGLQVVVVHDPLAPVVTTILNYKVGSDEQQYDGQAHALEHMMFRGSRTLSTNQLMDSIGITGGNFNADTENEVTQYYFTVPSQYLDIALQLERSRASGALISQADWDRERNAITQEVTRDYSSTQFRLFNEMEERVLAGSVYAKNGLGTRHSFEKVIQAPMLRRFYDAWYRPNNAVYVIAGDVDGPSTIAKVKALFGNLPSAKLPARTPVVFKPLAHSTYTTQSDLPVTLAYVGYRFPGSDSPDFAASQILSDVLSSQRGALYDLVAAGKSYQTGFASIPFNKASVGILYTAVPVGTKADAAVQDVLAVLHHYAKTGVPADLVEAAKRRVVADRERRADSIEGLAFEWSNALAVQHLGSPDDVNAAFERVTASDVNRVLRTYVTDAHSVVGFAVPKPGAQPSSGQGNTGENVAIPPSKHEALPAFAQHVLDDLKVPAQTLNPSDMTLANGIRLIVQPEHVSRSVELYGFIDSNADIQTPPGKEGVSGVVESLLPFGTTTYSRLEFQKELDRIAATTSAGTSFSLSVLSDSFARGVDLLADEEVHPLFPQQAFAVQRAQAEKAARDEESSPDHQAHVALVNALYPAGDPERRLETAASVHGLTLDDVKAYYASVYRPDMTTIVVVGDVTPDAARAAVEHAFGTWQARGEKPHVGWPVTPLNAAASVHVPAPQREQAEVKLQELMPLRVTDPEYAQVEVINTALTGGFYSSLLYHDLREVHGYVYNVQSSATVGRTRSSFGISFGADGEKVNAAQRDIVTILKDLQTNGLSAERLQRAKALLMGVVPIREASFDGVTSVLASYAYDGLPLNQGIIEAQRELATTNDQVKAAAMKYLRPDGFVRVVTGPAPK